MVIYHYSKHGKSLLCFACDQVLKELQLLAATSELRFEVSKHTALAFLIRRQPEDLQSLAEQLSTRHSTTSKQQTHRLDVAYSVLAAAADLATVESFCTQGGTPLQQHQLATETQEASVTLYVGSSS